MARNIGFEVEAPRKECEDPHCPFHGILALHGRIFNGVVIQKKMNRSCVVRRDYLRYLPKYNRYERQHSNINCHIPACIEISVGDTVKMAECRPISKTISFTIVELIESE
ncbi:MAG TPA: 30S ribosomal protein S17 [Candidatus Deferrimicrobium sp.]|nr:30S ribosomal protein S17 [Candidatus Deferrimicrobium sp.]